MNTIQLIYAGGTFGSHGSPLAPLPAETFLPKLVEQLANNLNLPAINQPLTTSPQIDIIKNEIIKDSSQLSIVDFFAFYQLILQQYQLGNRKFLLVTGTDTLSYLGAFLAEAFAHSDICIALTASMKPLFDPHSQELTIDKDSDAWANIQLAIAVCHQGTAGVRTCLMGETWHSQSVQKIHSHQLDAFSGDYQSTYPASHFYAEMPNKNAWINDRISQLPAMFERAIGCVISPIYLFPNQVDYLTYQIQQAISYSESQNKSANIILFGFGTGNIPYAKQLSNVLTKAATNNHLIIASTQCVYGGVSADYAAGSWQYEHGVLSAGNLTNEAIFARLAWLNLLVDNPIQRKSLWSEIASINEQP